MQFDPNRKPDAETLRQLPPLCTDGAWGTELAKQGAEPGQMCDTWNVDAPEKVLAVAKAYVDAGAQVILTNTFNSNRPTLARHGLEDRTAELCREGAAISREAAAGRAYVFASMGPCGKIVMMGEIDAGEVEASAAEQAAALSEGGADAIVIETQSDLAEVEAQLRGALSGGSVPVGVSFTFDAGENNDRTMMGVSVAEAVQLAEAQGAAFVGANCGAGIESFVGLARQFQETGTRLPVWVKGNAGAPEIDADGNTVFRATPATYATAVPELLGAGARFIGGCCGSTPAHVAAIAEAIRQAGS